MIMSAMTPERWQQIKYLFNSALERPLPERSIFLSEACGDDYVLRSEVESLLSSNNEAEQFIDAPAYEVAAELLDGNSSITSGRKLGSYQVMSVLGKGGMGAKTLQGCADTPGVYFHAIGGAATFLAQTVQKVLGVYKLEEFGVPEAMWVIEVQNFPVVVTMDAHGQSKHSLLDESSGKVLDDLLSRPY